MIVHRFVYAYGGSKLMLTSQLPSAQVRWVSFHSGYDFGYLMKLLTCKPLPHEEVSLWVRMFGMGL